MADFVRAGCQARRSPRAATPGDGQREAVTV